MYRQLLKNFINAWRLPRWRWALLIAIFADLVAFGLALLGPVLWIFDAVIAAALFAALGFRWSLLTALAIEVVPGLQLFPAWTLVVLALASTEKARAEAITDESVSPGC